MAELSRDLEPIVDEVASRATQDYVEGILSQEELAAQVLQEWERAYVSEDIPAEDIRKILKRIAQRICSRTLYEAWRSPEPQRCEVAYRNLKRYLKALLQGFPSTKFALRPEDVEDVLQHVLVELFLIHTSRAASASLKEPAAFLRWLQTILARTIHAFVEKRRRELHLSLDDQPDDYLEHQLAKGTIDGPQELVERDELQETLKHAILSLRSPRHRRVLLGLFLEGRDESELAELLQVQIQNVYTWKHRGLEALRRDPEVIRVLLQWLQC